MRAFTSLCALCFLACSTVPLYTGPRRPKNEVAVLMWKGTVVEAIDGLRVANAGNGMHDAYEILPGRHELAVRREGASALTATACVELAGGHRYRTEARVVGERWEPKVVDLDSGRSLDPFCAEAREAEVGRILAPVPVAARPAPAPDASATPPAPAAPVAAARDDEDPRATRAALVTAPARDEEDAPPPARRLPGSGLSTFAGYALGGEDFVKASNGSGGEVTLSSGKGLIFGLGGMLTPLWWEDTVGVGAGVDLGLKYDSIEAQNGNASITRFPFVFTAHLLTNFTGQGRHYLFLRAGVTRDFGVSYHGDGDVSVDVSPSGTWGGFFSAGYYGHFTRVFAWDVMLFVSRGDHVLPYDVRIDASSVGLTSAAHFNLM